MHKLNPFIDLLESSLFGLTGDITLLAIILFVVFLFLLVWRGVDFRYALMMLAPCLAKLSSGGWLPVWVEPVLWFFVVGFGLYLAWKAITPSY